MTIIIGIMAIINVIFLVLLWNKFDVKTYVKMLVDMKKLNGEEFNNYGAALASMQWFNKSYWGNDGYKPPMLYKNPDGTKYVIHF